MSNDSKSIHEFDFNIICEYFSAIERQGPGSIDTTAKALGFIDILTPNSKIADLGCGTGGQTMVMAQNAPGDITGIDLFPVFIDLFNQNARKLNLHQRVKGIQGSMDNLPFKDEELDLIWSEGAIYNIGFERGLKEWRRYIKKGGYVAVSEASWFTSERPKEINDFWLDAYSEIDTIPVKVTQLQNAGYVPVASFILPEECWTDNYYTPQGPAQELFLKKYPENRTAIDLIATQKHEAIMYEKYKDFYGYVFYIGRKY